MLQLLLVYLAEKIALILASIHPRKQAVVLGAVRVYRFALPAVMPRGHVLGPPCPCHLPERLELHLSVAQHIGVGRSPLSVFGKEVIHHIAPILFRKIHYLKGNREPTGNQHGKIHILVKGAIALGQARSLRPIAHVDSHHIVALLLEHVGRNARIYPARQSHHYPWHSTTRHLGNPRIKFAHLRTVKATKSPIEPQRAA